MHNGAKGSVTVKSNVSSAVCVNNTRHWTPVHNDNTHMYYFVNCVLSIREVPLTLYMPWLYVSQCMVDNLTLTNSPFSSEVALTLKPAEEDAVSGC